MSEQNNKILYFSAKWCGPCKIVATHIEETKEKLKNYVNIQKVDIEEEQKLSEEYNIKSIPTFVFVQDGEIKSTSTGVLTQKQMIEKSEKTFGFSIN